MPADYYEYLGVDADASTDEIESAYRDAVKVRHPDTGGSDVEMQALTEAREVLTSEKSRHVYDRMGHIDYVEQFGGVRFDADGDGDGFGGPASWERVSAVSTSIPDQEPDETNGTSDEGVASTSSGQTRSTTRSTKGESTGSGSDGGADTSASGGYASSESYETGFSRESSKHRFRASPFDMLRGFGAAVPALPVVFLASVLSAVPAFFVGEYAFELNVWATPIGYTVLLLTTILGTGVVMSYVSATPRSSDVHVRPYFTTMFLIVSVVFIAPFIWIAPMSGFENVSQVQSTYLLASGVVVSGLYYGGLLTVFFEHRVSRIVYAWVGAVAPAAIVVSLFVGSTPVQTPFFEGVPALTTTPELVAFVTKYAVDVSFVVYGVTVVVMLYEWFVLTTN